MYRKIDQNQLTLEVFNMPFGNRLSADYSWVKMAKIMPWELIEELYAKSFSELEERPLISARIAYEATHPAFSFGLIDCLPFSIGPK